MTSLESDRPGVDEDVFRTLCAEVHELMKRLEGSSVNRVSLQLGDARLEIERGVPAVLAAPADNGPVPGRGPLAIGAVAGLGISPEARSASGSFAAIGVEQDQRIPVLAPLVGTFYRAPQPGAKPFVEAGATVGVGDTVCIVEAMKLMNEVTAGEPGRVAEIVVADGERVEFEQVLMYLDPLDDQA
jgi:acetyl-CoA carboxylase biotin carboxyl carrier protein